MKITYKTNVLDIIRLVENNTPAFQILGEK